MNKTMICPVCNKEVDWLERYFDRHGIYSGKACSEKCSLLLPGRGDMENYEPEEPLDPD